MHARLVLPDATTRPVTLPAGPATPVDVIGALTCSDVVVVHLIQLAPPAPGDPGAGMWVSSPPAEGLELNPAAAAVAAFWAGGHAGEEFFGPVLVTGSPDVSGYVRPLGKDHDEIVTTIAGQIHASLHDGDAEPVGVVI